MNDTVKLATALLGFVALATAGAQEAFPAWQLVSARQGESAQLQLMQPVGAYLSELTGVEISGADVGAIAVSQESGVLQVELRYVDGRPLVITDVTLQLDGGLLRRQTAPTEVHWLALDPEAPLIVRDNSMSSSTPMTAAFLIENTSFAEIELTGIRYAPRFLSTGDLHVSTGFATLDGLDGISLTGATTTASTDDSGPRFESFNFADGTIHLGHGGQAILVLDGSALTNPLLFATGHTIGWSPWLEYTRDGKDYQLPLLNGPAGN